MPHVRTAEFNTLPGLQVTVPQGKARSEKREPALAALCLWSLQVIPVVNPEQSWHTRAPNKRETPPSLVPTTAGLARESLVHGEVVHAGIANLRGKARKGQGWGPGLVPENRGQAEPSNAGRRHTSDVSLTATLEPHKRREVAAPSSHELVRSERLRSPAHQVPALGTGHAAGVQEDLPMGESRALGAVARQARGAMSRQLCANLLSSRAKSKQLRRWQAGRIPSKY